MLEIELEIDMPHLESSTDEFLAQVFHPSLVEALNLTAILARNALGDAVDNVFAKATPFTKSAFGALPARQIDAEPDAVVFIKDAQEQYLNLEVFGGVRQAGDYATTVAGPLIPERDATLDSYGNLPRGWVSQELKVPGVRWAVVGSQHETYLVDRMADGQTEWLAHIVPEATYQAKFDFYGIVEAAVANDFEPAFADALERAQDQ